MKVCRITVNFCSIAAFGAVIGLAADTPNFAGEYANKNFLNGGRVPNEPGTKRKHRVGVSFAAAYKDGHGAAPEADGTGKG